MLETIPLEVRVSIDIGCHQHRVAIGLSHGEVLEEFDRAHQAEGFDHFFDRIAAYEQQYACPVAVAMEGFNGYARPLDTMIRTRDYRLYNINYLTLLIRTQGFRHAKLLHPRQHPLPQQGCFRVGRVGHQLGQLVGLHLGEANRFRDA
jgi:hypothetical protein